MKQESFEDRLKNKSEQFSMSPKAGLWEAVEAGLVPEKKKKRVPVFWFLAAVLSAGILWYGLSRKPAVSLPSAESKGAESSVVPSGDVTTPLRITSAEQGHASAHVGRIGKKEHQGNAGGFNKTDFVKKALAIQSEDHANAMMQETIISTETVQENHSSEIVDISNKPLQSVLSEMENETKEELPAEENVVEAEILKPEVDSSGKGIVHFAVPAPAFRCYIGAVFAPLQSSAILKLKDPGAQSSDDYTKRRASDKALYGYKAGVTAGLVRGRHSLHTGLLYSRMGYRMLLNNVESRPPSSSVVANNFKSLSKDSFKFTQPYDGGTYYSVQFNTLSVPLGYSYMLLEGLKWDIGINGTFTYNRLLNTNALMYDAQSGYYIRKQITENSQLHKNTGIISIGLDLNYRIGSAFSVSLNPQLGRTINSMESGAIQTGLKYWSVGAGFRWYLN